MSTRTIRLSTVVDMGVGLSVARVALPLVLTWLANLGARKVPGYHASVRRVSLDVMTPRLSVAGLSLVKLNGEHSLQVDSRRHRQPVERPSSELVDRFPKGGFAARYVGFAST